MNLAEIKSAADLAKTSPLNRDEWGEDIDPEDVLRLVEVARTLEKARQELDSIADWARIEKAPLRAQEIASVNNVRRLVREALEGIEP
jgi:hypothetical protein